MVIGSLKYCKMALYFYVPMIASVVVNLIRMKDVVNSLAIKGS